MHSAHKLQVDKYNDNTDQYRLKFGACKGNKRTLGFRHEGNGKALKTKDNYCLSTAKASKNDNTEIILTDCPSKLGTCLLAKALVICLRSLLFGVLT
jgi:hypothetical protein